jgi:hypothetical protein
MCCSLQNAARKCFAGLKLAVAGTYLLWLSHSAVSHAMHAASSAGFLQAADLSTCRQPLEGSFLQVSCKLLTSALAGKHCNNSFCLGRVGSKFVISTN